MFAAPYYKETRGYLERCIASVKCQTVRADHILILDGFPQGWIDQANVRRLRLDWPPKIIVVHYGSRSPNGGC